MHVLLRGTFTFVGECGCAFVCACEWIGHVFLPSALFSFAVHKHYLGIAHIHKHTHTHRSSVKGHIVSEEDLLFRLFDLKHAHSLSSHTHTHSEIKFQEAVWPVSVSEKCFNIKNDPTGCLCKQFITAHSYILLLM